MLQRRSPEHAAPQDVCRFWAAITFATAVGTGQYGSCCVSMRAWYLLPTDARLPCAKLQGSKTAVCSARLQLHHSKRASARLHPGL